MAKELGKLRAGHILYPLVEIRDLDTNRKQIAIGWVYGPRGCEWTRTLVTDTQQTQLANLDIHSFWGKIKTHRQWGRFCRLVYLSVTPNPFCSASSWAWRLVSVSSTFWSRPAAAAPVRPGAVAAPDHYWCWPLPTAVRCWGGWPCLRLREFGIACLFFGRATDSLCGGTQRTLLRAVHVPFKVMPVELGQLLWLLVLFCRPGLDPGLWILEIQLVARTRALCNLNDALARWNHSQNLDCAGCSQKVWWRSRRNFTSLSRRQRCTLLSQSVPHSIVWAISKFIRLGMVLHFY